MTVLSSRTLSRRWILLFSLGSLLLPFTASKVSAQTVIQSFGVEGKSMFPESTRGITALGIGDFDRDGDLDVFGGSFWGNSVTFFNDGSADFHRARVVVSPTYLNLAIAMGDVDGDKSLDCVLAMGNNGVTARGQTRLVLGDRLGRFSEVTATHMPKDSDNTNDLALGDVDGDEDLDLVLVNGGKLGKKGQQNRLYLNDGKGKFTDVTKTHMPVDADLSQSVVMGDLDGDGDLDMVIGNGHPFALAAGQPNKVYINNGKGKFTDASKIWRLFHSDVTNDLLLVDLDGDGDLDLVEANGTFYTGAQNRVYSNYGTPMGFMEISGSMLKESKYSTSLAVADLDSDGRLDLYVGNYRSPDRILLGNGRGSFSSPTKPLIEEDYNATGSVQIADFDADGNLDILCANSDAGLRLILGLGKGEFLETTTGPYIADRQTGIHATALADLNGDGRLDRVEAVVLPHRPQNGIWFGDGWGNFKNRTSSHFPKDGDFSLDVITGDIDGDGDIDVAFGNNGQNTLYLNDGTGHFKDVTYSHLPRDKALSMALAFGDVDGDKDLDLLIANVDAPNLLLLNNGKGRFTQAPLAAFPKDADETRDLKLADLDGDGDLDLFLANGKHRIKGSIGQQNRIYLNDGKGKFTDHTTRVLPKFLDTSYTVDAADVDGDGDLDLCVGNTDWLWTNGTLNTLLLNKGNGIFTNASAGRIPQVLDLTWGLIFADLDMDGDPDLLMLNNSRANMWGARAFLENNGKGYFKDMTSQRIGLPSTIWPLPLVADLDMDGDLDIIMGRSSYKSRIRQIYAHKLARIGQGYQVLFFAETGYGRPARLAVPLLSLAALPRPIPVRSLGWLALNPAQIVIGSPFLIPNDQAYLYELPLPKLPALVGLTIYTQGIVLHGKTGASARLTNAISDRILR
jgi:large repetitive protein